MEYTIDCSQWSQEKFIQLFGLLQNDPNTKLVVYREENPEKENVAMEKRVSEYLSRLGIAHHLKGYGYMKYGILNCIKYPEDMESVTKILYPKIAQRYGTTPGKVEHGIRHAIKIAWETKESEEWKKIFGTGYMARAYKPTNSQFIATLSEFININNNI